MSLQQRRTDVKVDAIVWTDVQRPRDHAQRLVMLAALHQARGEVAQQGFINRIDADGFSRERQRLLRLALLGDVSRRMTTETASARTAI